MTTNQKLVLEALADYPDEWRSAGGVAVQCDIKRAGATLESLVNRGLVESGRYTYRITPAGLKALRGESK